MGEQDKLREARTKLVEAGGRTSQDLGAGRIVGQVMVHLYLQRDAQSLDTIGESLALSKASISIAVRQLEQLGFVRRVWVAGDRKKYYRSADDIGSILQQGLLSFLRQKAVLFETEIDGALTMIDDSPSEEVAFLRQRMHRAKKLQNILLKLLDNPVASFFVGRKK